MNTQATTNCYKASPGSGPLANNLCFVDFTPLNNPAYLAVAETPGTCLEMSASLGPAYNYDKLFFCINITEPNGSNPTTGATPTDPEAWPVPDLQRRVLREPRHRSSGKSYAFYTGIPGNPAIYERVKSNSLRRPHQHHVQRHHGGDRFNALATNWAIVSADAESTDANTTTGDDEAHLDRRHAPFGGAQRHPGAGRHERAIPGRQRVPERSVGLGPRGRRGYRDAGHDLVQLHHGK